MYADRILLFTFFLAFAPFAAAVEGGLAAQMKEADRLRHAGRHAESVAVYKAALSSQGVSSGNYYNAACSAALGGDKELAFEWLRLAIAKGFTAIDHLKSDPDLKSLHEHPVWAETVGGLQRDIDRREAAYDKPLQAELLAIRKADQEGRLKIDEMIKQHGWDSKPLKELWATIEENDRANQAKIAVILDRHGWVGPDKVGAQASGAIFLVIQHADLSFQQKYLPLMRAAVKENKARPANLALLEDRVALDEGRRQRYGSQIGRDDATGLYYVMPVEDPDRVDEFRAEVGLMPLAEYVKRWNLTWDPTEHKKLREEREKKSP